MKVAIIGGGAAGFFAALAAKENHPTATVTVFEKSSKLLAKVKVSGGGRCNVTNGCSTISELIKAYPRGTRQLKKAFRIFSTQDTMNWFEQRGVPLVIQEDNCVFPESQSSQSIIDCFLKEARRLEVNIKTSYGVKKLQQQEEQWLLSFLKEDQAPEVFDKVIVATGGSPKRSGLAWLEDLGHKIEEPVPSLFTFNMPGEAVRELMGVVVEPALANIQGTKLKADGPLLITHWGMSGPAILKLSAHGARILSEKDYRFNVQINWTASRNDDTVRDDLKSIARSHPKKNAGNLAPYDLPKRLWRFLLTKAQLTEDKVWGEIGKNGINKLVSLLTNDVYAVQGKTTFKEEFVTCGGVSLQDVDFKTLQSRVCKNLYFAGEVLDIDGITGGYNFQSAWTTAFIAGKLA
ncbi:NAD(P)/FAD-dependent oxidoreductase [Lewinella cohaerens]|uniref:NAD(P)/FAD-dependent oxidoreductase n=1 Tax=Lewinella cohaerens TaxID=70995 RepID=UPI00036A1C61|nr:NAD(P)/FAD-dependent oxidoreductase [Lewinella cohaerens]